jgi:cytochrome b
MHDTVERSSEPADCASSEPQLVWDLPLRLFHWLLAASVTGSFVTHYVGTAAFEWHARFGYATLVLVTFRIAWGFVGPAHARFGDFVRGPRAAFMHVRSLFAGAGREKPGAHVAGHNPLGGWMVLLLLALLLVQSVAGLFANDEIFNTGPLYGYVGMDRSNEITSLHARLSDVILYAVGLHVAAAFWYLLVRRENLIGAMVTGYKRGLPRGAAIGSQRVALAAAIAGLASVALWWIIRNAPEAYLFSY